jgi:hypothetical protein
MVKDKLRIGVELLAQSPDRQARLFIIAMQKMYDPLWEDNAKGLRAITDLESFAERSTIT